MTRQAGGGGEPVSETPESTRCEGGGPGPAAFLAALPQGAAVLDSGFRPLACNPAFTRLTGVAAGDDGGALARLPCIAQHRLGAAGEEWQEAELTGGMEGDGPVPVRCRLGRLPAAVAGDPAYLLLLEPREPPDRDLVEARTQLVQARARFLTGAGHDLRQPLNALSLFLGVLRSAKTLERALDVAARMQGTLDALIVLFNGLYTLSKFESGLVPVRAEPLEIGGLLETLLDEFEAAADTKRLPLRVVPSRAKGFGDGDLLLIALRGFLANAVGFTETGGILIGCRRRAGRVRIDVIDTGPGIPAAQVGQMFEPLVRSRNGGGSGYGIGLAVARAAAELAGCPVEVDSRPGRGSRFSLYVPALPGASTGGTAAG